jgi:hypothetical protein
VDGLLTSFLENNLIALDRTAAMGKGAYARFISLPRDFRSIAFMGLDTVRLDEIDLLFRDSFLGIPPKTSGTSKVSTSVLGASRISTGGQIIDAVELLSCGNIVSRMTCELFLFPYWRFCKKISTVQYEGLYTARSAWTEPIHFILDLRLSAEADLSETLFCS